MAVAAAGGKILKVSAGIGIVGSLLFGAAYTATSIKSVAPKAGEGAGLGVGGGILFLKSIPGGIQEMQTAPIPTVPPAAAPPAAQG